MSVGVLEELESVWAGDPLVFVHYYREHGTLLALVTKRRVELEFL